METLEIIGKFIVATVVLIALGIGFACFRIAYYMKKEEENQ